MPKRVEFKRNNIWSRNSNNNQRVNRYDEHDDRDRRPADIKIEVKKGGSVSSNKRVSFKPSNIHQNKYAECHHQNNKNSKGKLRAAEMGIRARLEEDDEMDEFGHSSKGNTFRRRNSPIPGSARNNRAIKGLIENASGWFQVTIPYGNKYDKNLLQQALMGAIAPEAFMPYYWMANASPPPGSVTFFVDDFKLAKTLANLDRTIEMPNGFKLIIKVRNGLPKTELNETLRERMKLAMARRYNASTKALDLTKFHADDELRNDFCGLFRPPIMLAAIDIIAENIPDLEALNLDNNKLQSLDHFKCLATKLPHLKILHMANNKITAPGSLEPLRSCNIANLVLKGNPIRDRFRNETAYISEVRKRLPKLQILDGVDLPPQIGFDIEAEEEVKVPPAKASFLCDQTGAEIVRQFLEQYFIIFDSDNRQPLLDAYHENAMFSMTCTYHPNPDYRLTKYLPHNRNLNRLWDVEKRMSQLKSGRLPVVSFLSELPQTEHDPQSFAVDLTLFTPSLILLSVTGIFREKQNTSSARNELRSFHRSLVIVPMGSGFCIKNDMLHVNILTMAQVKTAFKPIAPVSITTGPVQAPIVPTPTSALAIAGTAQQQQPNDVTKMQMVQAMSQLSNMNVEWSTKCLEETNWDFDRAGYVFSELHKQNKIPPEAFIK